MKRTIKNLVLISSIFGVTTISSTPWIYSYSKYLKPTSKQSWIYDGRQHFKYLQSIRTFNKSSLFPSSKFGPIVARHYTGRVVSAPKPQVSRVKGALWCILPAIVAGTNEVVKSDTVQNSSTALNVWAVQEVAQQRYIRPLTFALKTAWYKNELQAAQGMINFLKEFGCKQ